MENEYKKLIDEISRLNFFNVMDIKNFIANNSNVSINDLISDNYNNITYLNENSKNLILFTFNPIGVMINEINNNRINLDKIGRDNKKQLNGKNISIGTIKKDDDRYYVEKNDKIICSDNQLFNIKESHICEGDSLYTIQSNAYIPLIMLIKLLFSYQDTVNEISFTLINKPFSSECGYIEIINRFMPENLVVVSLCYENETTKIGSGPSIVIKDGNGVTKECAYSKLSCLAADNNISYQFYIGKTDKVYECISLSKSRLNYSGIYIPVKKASADTDKILYDDVEKTLNLLLKYIATL